MAIRVPYTLRTLSPVYLSVAPTHLPPLYDVVRELADQRATEAAVEAQCKRIRDRLAVLARKEPDGRFRSSVRQDGMLRSVKSVTVVPRPRKKISTTNFRHARPDEYQQCRVMTPYKHFRRSSKYRPKLLALAEMPAPNQPVRAAAARLWWPRDWDDAQRHLELVSAGTCEPHRMMSLLEWYSAIRKSLADGISMTREELDLILASGDPLGLGEQSGTPVATTDGWEFGYRQLRFNEELARARFPEIVNTYTDEYIPSPYTRTVVVYTTVTTTGVREDGTFNWVVGGELDELDGQ